MKTATKMEMGMEQLAAQVALALSAETGDSWAARPVYNDDDACRASHQYLVRADKLRLWMSGPDWSGKDRLTVTHSPDNDLSRVGAVYDGGARVDPPDSISVSALKNPSQIARDISRRLLPDASIYFEKLKAQHAKDCEAANARLAFFHKLGAASGGKLNFEYRMPDLTRPHFSVSLGGKSETWDRHGYGEITVSSGDSCKITLESVPPDVALTICEFLRDNVYAETPAATNPLA